jgi:DNA-directed RNA polymerase specialized sigma24 family protein
MPRGSQWVTPRWKWPCSTSALDVVQSVWADLLRGFRNGQWHFRDPAQLRAFLIRATHNRFLNRVRRHHHELEHEQALPEAGSASLPAPGPCPSEVA